MARVVFRDVRIYLIQLLTKIRHTLSQRQSLNTDKEHLRKMLRGMFWLMLLIISAKMAYSLWRYFSFSAEYTAVSSSANKPLRADAKPFDKNDVQLVSQQNWFGKYQPVAAPVKQPESAPVAETRLNVVLRGIAFGARPGAVIEEGGKQQVYLQGERLGSHNAVIEEGGKQQVYLQGERLGSHNAVIEEINRDHVMLRYQGKIERLSLAEEERSTVAVTNKKSISDEAKQAVAEPAASAPVEIPAAVRQALAKDPQKIFNYIQLTPVRKEGIVGYAVKPGADRSLFDASGFREGDIAIALNQQDFTDPRAMIALMRQLPSMDSIQLTVLRKGARYDISIALR
ncbi:TPA: type II secretion system protein GspC [Escherichia coli]